MTDATLIFGLGVTGYSCVKYLREECDVAICDTREHPPYLDAVRREYPGIPFFGSDQVRLGDFDRIVVSPGVRLDHGLVAAACAAGLRIVGDIDLFLAAVEAPVVGITGTNGKSTVTTLVGELLNVGHNKVGVGGNLGVAALDLIDPTRTHYVLELSSFQLERLGSAHFDVATVLNVSDDHLDRYVSFEAYAQAKRRIYDGCRRAVYDMADPTTTPPPGIDGIALNGDLKWCLEAGSVVLDGRRVPVDEFRLRGRHNLKNLLSSAAIAWSCGVSVEEMMPRLTSFGGLAHRCAPVGRVGSIECVNDSKATNIGACLAALEGLGDPLRRHIVLIAGGDAKGASFDALLPALESFVRHVVLLGRDAQDFAACIAGKIPVSHVADIDEAVDVALRTAADGDLVLLSPACSSLDMFDNFEARGDAFAEAVRSRGAVID